MQQSTRSRLLLFWYVTRLFYGLRHFHSVSWICETHADEGRRGRLMLPWLLYQGERCPCYLLYLHLSAYISSSSFSVMCQIHSFDKLSKKGSKKQRGNLLFEVAPEEIGEYRRPTSLKGKRANRLCERGRPTFPASASAPSSRSFDGERRPPRAPLLELLANVEQNISLNTSKSLGFLRRRRSWRQDLYKYFYRPCLKEPPEAPEENERLVRAASAPPAPPRIPVSSAGQSITFELFMASLWGRLPPSTSVFMAQCIKVALDCFFFE